MFRVDCESVFWVNSADSAILFQVDHESVFWVRSADSAIVFQVDCEVCSGSAQFHDDRESLSWVPSCFRLTVGVFWVQSDDAAILFQVDCESVFWVSSAD